MCLSDWCALGCQFPVERSACGLYSHHKEGYTDYRQHTGVLSPLSHTLHQAQDYHRGKQDESSLHLLITDILRSKQTGSRPLFPEDGSGTISSIMAKMSLGVNFGLQCF